MEHPRQFAESLKIDHSEMLYYIRQQIEQFRQQMPDFEVHHMTENMNQTLEELKASFLNSLPPEDRLQGLSSEERVRGLPAKDRLNGLPDKEVIEYLLQKDALSVLGEAELTRLRKLLDERTRNP